MKKEAGISKRRLRSSYITSIISISLVLFLLGLIGILLINAKRLSDHVRENIGFTIILNDDVREVDILRLQKELDARNYIKSTRYVSKEDALREMQEELGEDFLDFLGYNPLGASIDLRFYASYANSDSITKIEKEIGANEEVKEVFYQKSLLNLVNENIRKISFIILIFSVLLFLIAVALINNTIRLSVYSKRFLINTMKLVGATKAFIRKPFLYRSAGHGAVAALISLSLLSGIIYLINREFSGIIVFMDVGIIGTLVLGVILFGIFLNWISTLFAVNRYLRMHSDNLYY